MKLRAILSVGVTAIIFAFTGAGQSMAQAVTWQILPWFDDASWPFTGHPTLFLSSRLICEGRQARTVQTFSKPKVVTFDVTLDERQADDGQIGVSFIPTGTATNLSPLNATGLFIVYRGAGQPNGSDVITLVQTTAGSDSKPVGEIPFTVQAGVNYRVRIAVSAAASLTVSVNNVQYITGVTLPYDPFQIQVWGWQPLNRWTVKNFRVR